MLPRGEAQNLSALHVKTRHLHVKKFKSTTFKQIARTSISTSSGGSSDFRPNDRPKKSLERPVTLRAMGAVISVPETSATVLTCVMQYMIDYPSQWGKGPRCDERVEGRSAIMSSNTEAVNLTAERQTIQRHHVRQTERQSIRRWATTRHVSGEQDVKEIAGTSIGRREVHIRIDNDAKFTLM